MRLRVVILVYLALFVGELSWSGVTPLIPSYIEQYDLSDFEGGLVLSVASFGILVASLPASAITRRVSPRTMMLSAMAVIALAGFAMALAPDYRAIVLARLIFGLGFGTLWVSMAAWLDDAAGQNSAKVLALTTSVVGVSSMLGPAYAGWVADRYGISAPFVGLAIITALLFVLLLFDRSGTGLRKDPAPPFREIARAVRSDPDLVTMLLLTIAAAVVWMTADLLVPLRLDLGWVRLRSDRPRLLGVVVGVRHGGGSDGEGCRSLGSARHCRHGDRWACGLHGTSCTASRRTRHLGLPLRRQHRYRGHCCADLPLWACWQWDAEQ